MDEMISVDAYRNAAAAYEQAQLASFTARCALKDAEAREWTAAAALQQAQIALIKAARGQGRCVVLSDTQPTGAAKGMPAYGQRWLDVRI